MVVPVASRAPDPSPRGLGLDPLSSLHSGEKLLQRLSPDSNCAHKSYIPLGFHGLKSSPDCWDPLLEEVVGCSLEKEGNEALIDVLHLGRGLGHWAERKTVYQLVSQRDIPS